jgi:hypothetical protein
LSLTFQGIILALQRLALFLQASNIRRLSAELLLQFGNDFLWVGSGVLHRVIISKRL